VHVDLLRKADAGIADGEGHMPLRVRFERNDNLPGAVMWEGMFQGIGNELVEHEATRHRRVEWERDLINVRREADTAGIDGIRLEELGAQVLQIRREVKPCHIGGLIEGLVDACDGVDTLLALPKELLELGLVDGAALLVEQATDDLQVVFHAVVNLREEYLFFLEGGAQVLGGRRRRLQGK